MEIIGYSVNFVWQIQADFDFEKSISPSMGGNFIQTRKKINEVTTNNKRKNSSCKITVIFIVV